MSTFNVEVQGLDAVKQMFEDIGHQLSGSGIRAILDEAGKVIVNQARNETPYTGQIGDFFKRDLAVFRDHRSSAKNAEYVLIGPRFKLFNIHGKDQKAALIAQHMTTGFRQTERVTKAGRRRGKVSIQSVNPILDAFRRTEKERNDGIGKGVIKQLEKVKKKYPGLVK